jgi:hypothetical protein
VRFMTTKVTNTKPNPFRRYALAASKCKRLSGVALSTAQDEERDAIFDLAGSRTAEPKFIGKKQKITIDLQREGPWLDGRDVAMLDSIRRDLRRLSRRAA